MNPSISIIVPVYNVENYINKCIDSILNQTFVNFELILVNDGSTDKSASVCDEYAKQDNRIKVIHKKNGGQSTARNMGLDTAIGEYIGFIDSDDWIHKDMYQVLLESAKKNDADIVACNFYLMTKNNKFNVFTLNAQDKIYTKDSAMKEIYTNKILSFSPCNKMYKRQLFSNIRFLENIILEDMDISYKLMNISKKVSYIKEPLYFYRYNKDSTLRSSFSLKHLDEYTVKTNMYLFYLNEYPEISDLVYSELFFTGINFYILVCIHYPEVRKDYEYLIDFDKTILKRLIRDTKLDSKRKKNEIRIFLIMPKIYIQFNQLIYKLKKIINKYRV